MPLPGDGLRKLGIRKCSPVPNNRNLAGINMTNKLTD